MLTRLFIQNLATIEKQIIEFGPGFTALTGETGAGKSVMIKALRLILGEKCPKDLIRAGETFLSIEAVFSIESIQPIKELLEEMDIDHEEELVIRRKVHQSGKNTIFLNDYSSNLSKLALFGNYLADLHGQHSQQSLLSPATHINYLDAFAGLNEKVLAFSGQYRMVQQLITEKQQLQQNASDRNKEIDFLRFQIHEIDSAGFTIEEELSLNEEIRILSNSEQLISALAPIADWKSNEPSALSTISSSLAALEGATRLDSKLEPIFKEIESSLISLEEAAGEIAAYVSRLDINPQRLEDVNKRLSELDVLKRKYGQTMDDILEYQKVKEQELEQLQNQEISCGELEGKIKKLVESLKKEAEILSKARREAKQRFEEIISKNLQELGMERSVFEIRMEAYPKNENTGLAFSSKGLEQVEFLIATNPGNPLRPLTKIASGGELSRIMLAIKTSLNEDISHGSMIFDEVDAGISGRVAETVGYKLENLGHSRQIICITHSPQIASKAKDHFKVKKVIENESSKTLITKLNADERIEEIAQFLGGNAISDKTRSAAREMLTPSN
ncbi:DNA repair protein RecN [bacterium]|nr:DNA repair protein RecN [bacterium]